MRQSIHRAWCRIRPRTRTHGAVRVLRIVLVSGTAALLLLLVWPYTTLWRLDQAVRADDPAALAGLVNLARIQDEIKRKLNKDADSDIGPMSDRFIQWLEKGIHALGSDAVERLVTLEWVRERLLAHAALGKEGAFLGQVSYAFFDRGGGFRVHIGPPAANPTRVRLQLQGLDWRISAIYY